MRERTGTCLPWCFLSVRVICGQFFHEYIRLKGVFFYIVVAGWTMSEVIVRFFVGCISIFVRDE